MSQAYSRRLVVAWFAIWGLSALVGCGGSTNAPPATPPPDIVAPRALNVFYQEFMAAHNSRPPKDEAEFRAFLESMQQRLSEGGLTIDQVLTSPDGDKWIIGYGTPIEIEGRRYAAYSATAVDGQRSAINERGGVEKVDDAKFQALPAR